MPRAHIGYILMLDGPGGGEKEGRGLNLPLAWSAFGFDSCVGMPPTPLGEGCVHAAVCF